jgi:hypothetical protein
MHTTKIVEDKIISISGREQNLGEFDILAQAISMCADVKDEDLQKCCDILNIILRNNEIKISELTLMASFRYALGRTTYIVSEVVENILKNWDQLSDKIKINMTKEIKDAIDNNNIGNQIDLEQWHKISTRKLDERSNDTNEIPNT